MSSRVLDAYPGILVSVKDAWSPLGNNVYPDVTLTALLNWQRSGLVHC